MKNENIIIVGRFFEIMETLKKKKIIRGLKTLCDRYGWNRWNVQTMREDPAGHSGHTWATIAAALDVPDDVISQALGHAARNSTTAIYIERSQRKVDEANRRVINFVLKG